MLPLAGSIHALVVGVTPVSIHGDLYYDLLIQTPDDASAQRARQIRAPQHACAEGQPPAPGQHVEIQFLMQQVTAVRSAPRG